MAQETILQVDGMSCTGCERNVQFALSALPGVKRVKADHRAKTVEVDLDPAQTTEDEIRRAVEDIGYTVVG